MPDDFGYESDSEFGNLGEKSLKQILDSMLIKIEGSKSQLYDVYEAAKREVESSQKELSEVRRELESVTREMDSLERAEQEGKQNLVRESSRFSNYSETRIQEAYDTVRTIQVQIGSARERERHLRQMQLRLESRVLHLQKTVQGAERLAMRIGSMLNYLGSQLSDVVSQLEAASKNKFLSAAIIRAQEEERLRVSREMHDGPAQDVANLMLEASIAERLIDYDPDEAKKNIQELRRHLHMCLDGIRKIIFDMRPMSLDDLGLIAAVEQVVRNLHESTGLSVSMAVEGKEAAIPQHVKTALFRIVQEALNNIVHHANTRRAKLRLLFTDSSLSVLVEDEGEGFDAEALDFSASSQEGHFGLLGMKERATIIGAEFSIYSKKGEGTKIHLRLPLNPATEEASGKEKKKKNPHRRIIYEDEDYSEPNDPAHILPDIISASDEMGK